MLNPQLVNIAAKVFDVPADSLSPQTGMGDLEAWDSLGHLRFMMELEREFHARFSTEQIRTLIDLAEIQNALPTHES